MCDFLELLKASSEESASREVGWRRAGEATMGTEVVEVGPPAIEDPLGVLKIEESM